MKTKLIILSICIAMLSIGASAKIKDGKSLSGNSLTSFGNYTVVNSEVPMKYKKEALKTYNLSYENTNVKIQIGILCEDEFNCKTFIVRSAEFEIEYTCRNNVFGAKKIEKRFRTLSKEEMDMKINRVSYLAQRVICRNIKSEDELLGLIACYFPMLIQEEYQAAL